MLFILSLGYSGFQTNTVHHVGKLRRAEHFLGVYSVSLHDIYLMMADDCLKKFQPLKTDLTHFLLPRHRELPYRYYFPRYSLKLRMLHDSIVAQAIPLDMLLLTMSCAVHLEQRYYLLSDKRSRNKTYYQY
jgi:hypothetical protein